VKSREGRQEKWAKIPESSIVGEFLPGISTQKRLSAFLLFCYLDLRQGERGWPVRGFRYVAKEIGLQDRTVASAARTLSEAGLIELTLTIPVATSAVMRVIHNPARARVNPDVALGSPSKRYRHETLPYPASSAVRDSHTAVQDAHAETPTPDARNATGSRSMRSAWSEVEACDALPATVSDEPRCTDCLGLIRVHGRRAEPAECCTCPLVSEVG
jgi:hypothetical protein